MELWDVGTEGISVGVTDAEKTSSSTIYPS